MKKIFLLVVINLLFIVGCGKRNNDNIVENQKNEFKTNVENILKLVNNSGINEYQEYGNRYLIKNGYLYGYTRYPKNEGYSLYLIADIEKYNFSNGVIFQKNSDEIYLSIENKELCAIKDFESNEILIYDMSNSDKCHKYYVNGDNISLNIKTENLNNKEYIPGTISNEYVSLLAVTNIIDKKSYNYQWYRNDEKIENANVQNYTVAKDYEDANYYVEITTNTGEVYKSESVNVKINKQ